MDVYLVRHAIAAERDDAEWPDDSKRPLTEDGSARFERAARGLARIVPGVEVVFSSPYVRAWETAEILAEQAGWPAPVPALELEAERAPDDAVALLRRHAGIESIALVGHEPHLSLLASLLLVGHGSKVEIELKKGGVVALTRWTEDEAFLRWVATPKLLRALD
jgi:phosphohistidine phosphatase